MFRTAIGIVVVLVVAGGQSLQAQHWGPPVVLPAAPYFQAPQGHPFRQPCGGPCFAPQTNWRCSWLGGYGGGFVSAAGVVGTVNLPLSSDLTIEDGGLGYGALLGYNFLARPTTPHTGWVMGAEVDYTSINTSAVNTQVLLGDVKLDSNWLASIMLRAGYATPQTFAYGMVGAVATDAYVGPAVRIDDDTSVGLGLGVGIEQKFGPVWSARVDALGYLFGDYQDAYNGSVRDSVVGAGQVRLALVCRF